MFSEVIWISIDSDEKPEHFEEVLTVHSLPNKSKDKVSRNLYVRSFCAQPGKYYFLGTYARSAREG